MSNVLQVRTAIIGSGVSGISTAMSLLNKDYKDFLIFEALDRVGGRVHTIDYGDAFLEIGAQYIHGQVNNPIYKIAKEHQQIEPKYNRVVNDYEESDSDSDAESDDDEYTEDRSENPKDIFVTQFGKRINLGLAYKIYEVVEHVADEASEFFEKNKDIDYDRPVAEYMIERFNKIVEKKFKSKLKKDKNGEFRKLLNAFIAWKCKYENIEASTESMLNISLNNFNIYQEMKGSQIMQLNNGYKEILRLIINEHNNDFYARLRLKHVLRKILLCNKLNDSDDENCEHCRYSSDIDEIVLILDDCQINGERKELIVLCENVVCTMCLGYLKASLKDLIEPKSFIPREKLEAVSRLGFGTVNKIFMEYDEPFWNSQLVSLMPILLPKNNESVQDQLRNFNEDNWTNNISYFEPVKDFSNIMSVWIAGCEFVEKLEDQTVIEDITALLKKLMGRNDIPYPRKMIRSKWNSEPFFRGVYSHLPLGSDREDFKRLAKPISVKNEPKIMFAGEATITDYYSTVHGAYFSGQREAKRILEND